MQVFRKIGFPFSLPYAVAVYLRNYLYNIGFFTSKSFNTPTICIGNLSVGGTGKTPMIEFLIFRLKDIYRLAVLSRGYKRKSKGFVLAQKSSKVEDLGDEPFQMYAKFPEIILAVDADRSHGITVLEQEKRPELILLDDAFQHRKVRYGFSILLTEYANLYIDDWYLPTGNLRDSKGQAERANLIVVTKCPLNINEDEQKKIEDRLAPKAHQKLIFSTLHYNTALKGNKEALSLIALKGKEVCVVTGIASPGPLLSYLSSEGLHIEHLRFRDHHFFDKREIDLFNSKELVLTTEKDFARLKGRVKNLVYLEVSHRFLGNGEELLMKSIHDFMG